MNTSLNWIVTAVIADLNENNASIKEQEEAIKNLYVTVKLAFNCENKQEVERELFCIAQQCRDGMNSHCGVLAMKLLEQYMA